VTLQIEDDLSRLLQSPEQPAEQAARELIVLELYRQRRFSSGRAAELMGSSKVGFLGRASALGLAYIDMSEEELEREIAEAEALSIGHRL
jgi:predicted HTH domain antitoxin